MGCATHRTQSPDLPCDLFNDDFSCNKSERFCGGLSITSLSLFQLIRVHTINHANYAFSTTVDRVHIDIAGLNASVSISDPYRQVMMK